MRVLLVIPAVLLAAAPSLASAQGRARASAPASAPRTSAPRASAPRASAPRASSAPAVRHSRPAANPAPAADGGRRVIGARPRPVITGRPLLPPRAPHYVTSPRPSRPGYYAPDAPYWPYSPYSPYRVPRHGYRRLPGLAPIVVLVPGVTTVERGTTVYAPDYDQSVYDPAYDPAYDPGYEPAPVQPRILGGGALPVAPTLAVEMPADSLLRVRWTGDDQGVVEVALLVADAERRVLATQSVLDPPYTALFDRPARAAYAGVTLTYAGGASTTILQPLAAPARGRD